MFKYISKMFKGLFYLKKAMLPFKGLHFEDQVAFHFHKYLRLSSIFKKYEVVFHFQKHEVVFHLPKKGGHLPELGILSLGRLR